MPRTRSQNFRRKTITFRQHVVDYRDGKRKRPPRIKLGMTMPSWSSICQELGLDPKHVYDDYAHYQEALKKAEELRIPLAKALSVLWESHCAELVATATHALRAEVGGGAKVGVGMPDPDEGEGLPDYLNDAEARRMAEALLTKFRSKES